MAKKNIKKSNRKAAATPAEAFSGTFTISAREPWVVAAEKLAKCIRDVAREQHIGASTRFAMEHLATKADAIVSMQPKDGEKPTAKIWTVES